MDWKLIIYVVLLVSCLTAIGVLIFHLHNSQLKVKQLWTLLDAGYKKEFGVYGEFVAPDGWKSLRLNDAVERAELQQKVAKYGLGDESKVLLQKFTSLPPQTTKSNVSKSEISAWLKK